MGIYFSAPKGYKGGWLACNKSVVPTREDACSHARYDYGQINLDRKNYLFNTGAEGGRDFYISLYPELHDDFRLKIVIDK